MEMRETCGAKPCESEEAFLRYPERWMEHHGSYLFHYALARVRDSSVAEELVQDTLFAALQGRRRFRKEAAGRTWLTAILKNKTTDYLRRKVRERNAGHRNTEDLRSDAAVWEDRSWQSNPSIICEQNEFFEVFSKCLEKLPRRYSRVFILRELQGMSTAELCSTLKISPANSWVIVHRARLRLQQDEELQPYLNSDQ